MAVGVRGNSGDFAKQTVDLELPHLGVLHIPGLRVNRGERRQGADEHAHGMGIIPKAFQKLFGRFVQHRVVSDVGYKILQFRRGRQFAVQHEISHLQITAFFG